MLLIALAVCALVSMAGALALADTLRGQATAINLAGALRMYSYRVAVIAAAEPHNTAAGLDAVSTRLTDPRLTTAALGAGDAASDALKDVTTAWEGSVRRALTHTDPAGRLSVLTAFQDRLDHLVRTLEAASETRVAQLWWTQAALLATTLSLLAITAWQIRSRVLKPLTALLTMARKMEEGDTASRVTWTGADELGVLGRTLNNAASALGRQIDTLAQDVADKQEGLARSHARFQYLYRVAGRLQDANGDEAALRAVLDDLRTTLGAQAVSLTGPVVDLRSGPHQTGTPVETVDVRVGDTSAAALRVWADGANAETDAHTLAVGTAAHLGRSLEQRERIDTERKLAVLEERNLIARELHDSLAQSLSFVRIQLTVLKRKVGHTGNTELIAAIENMDNAVERAYKELRVLLDTFRVAPNEGGLIPALKAEIERYEGNEGTPKIELHLPPKMPTLEGNEETHVLHIVKEALANAVRHANATSIQINLKVELGSALYVSIEDNGCGYAGTLQPSGHYGLRSMQDRASALGGYIKFETGVGDGMRVLLSFYPELGREHKERTS